MCNSSSTDLQDEASSSNCVNDKVYGQVWYCTAPRDLAMEFYMTET